VSKQGAEMRTTDVFIVFFVAVYAGAGCTQSSPAPASSKSASPSACSDGSIECGPKTATPSQSSPGPQAAPPPPSSAGAAAATPSGSPVGTWTFDADRADAPPAHFSFGRTGDGRPGRWIVKAEPDAPSGGNVLAQTDADDADARFPVAVANEPSLRDVRLSVRCKPVSGKVDQACGVVFRYKDENNYYVTRANALEGNVRLYYVKDGRRKQFAGWSGAVTANAWHELRADARGDHFEVYFDGAKVIEADDKTFPDGGKVGVWTKADSVTYFDDLSAAPL
jgi:hypothetical protein